MRRLWQWHLVVCLAACTQSDKRPAEPAVDSGASGPAVDSGETDPTTGAADTAAPADTAEHTDTADTDDTDDTDDTAEPAPLHGEPLDPPIAPPAFALLDQDGVTHTEADLLGGPTVIWFFRDTASSCTNDACGYRDLQSAFDELGVRIVAVGPTTVEANAAWAASLDYRYQIWSDSGGILSAAYGTESEFDEGSLRHAFIIDADANAIFRYEGAVSVGADPTEVLADCRALFGP